jgi:hypothetical protein
MHITDSQLTLGSKHALEKTTFRETTLERLRGPGDGQAFGGLFEQELNKLMAVRLDESAPIQLKPCSAAERIHDMVETMLAALFGSKSDTRSLASSALAIAGDTVPRDQAAAVPDLPRPRWQITQTERVSETESCEFAASGKVCLADGSTRQFDVGYTFERSEEITRTVSRTLIDPLVVDSAAPRAALSDASVDFDLDNDGTLEQMRLPGTGSAFLFLDRNHNGRADNGSELFGPESGNGFAELARLDSDRNGWIDEADPAFADLRLWQGMEDDQQFVRRLDEAGVGALATSFANTPFALKEDGEQVGQMRSSSVWLGETGSAGVVRQIDVSTTPVTDKTV